MRPGRCQLVIDALEQLLLCLAPSDAVSKGLAHAVPLGVVGERAPHLKDRGVVGVLRLTGLEQVGFDFVNGFLKLFRRTKKWNGIAVAFTHFATIQALQHRDIVIDHGLG